MIFSDRKVGTKDSNKQETGGGSGKKNPRSSAGIWSILTFSWTLSFIRASLKRDLRLEDVYEPLEGHRAQRLGPALEIEWLVEQKRQDPSLVLAIFRLFRKELLLCWFFIMVNVCFVMVSQVYVLSWLVDSFSSSEFDPWRSASLGGWYILLDVAVLLATHGSFQIGLVTAVKMSAALSHLIYKKTLRLPLGGRGPGHVISLLSGDLRTIKDGPTMAPYLWAGPIQLGVLAYGAWRRMRPATMGGVAFIVITSIITGLLGRYMGNLRNLAAEATDARASLMSEIISNIKTIKIYCWERHFQKRIKRARRKELNVTRLRSGHDGSSVF